jgi:pimeloyl-ACP methyl ester carboxylesterase
MAGGRAQTPQLINPKYGTHKAGGLTYKTTKAYIDVPENRSDSASRLIRLPVFIIHSPAPQPAEPVFYFRGGPGASNIVTTDNTLLLAKHDFVCVGYRGADGPVLKSKKVGRAVRGKKHQLLSNESLDNSAEVMTRYCEKLEQQGVHIASYTVMDVIEDVEYARKALGYGRIHALSSSYGTRVALLYSYKYPDVIFRSVMIGANPPGNFFWDPAETDRILDRYDSIYHAQHPDSVPGIIKANMKKAFAKMPKRWRGLRLDADKIKVGTFMLLFSTQSASMAFEAFFNAAYKDDYSGLYAMQMLYDVFVPRTYWGDMMLKGFSADFEPDSNYRQALGKYGQLVLGPHYTMVLWGPGARINIKPIPAEYRTPRVSQTPTLIISGTLDVSTPAVNAVTQLMPYLPNGHHLLLPNASHQDLKAQKQSYEKYVAGFFDTGVADDSLFTLQEVNFKPAKSLGKIARRFYPVILVMRLFM